MAEGMYRASKSHAKAIFAAASPVSSEVVAPRQPSSSPHPAPSPHQSPAQPSPREPSPTPQDKKRKRTATLRRGKRSPKRKQEPLPKIPKVAPKRAYDCIEEETAAIVDAETTAFFAKLRR